MMKCAPVWRLLLSLFLALSFAGCSQFKRSSVEEEKDPHFLEARRRASGLDFKGAIQAYERALQSNPNNSAAHFEAGLLHDRKLNNYAAAIYHYEKHLALRPNSQHRDFLKNQIPFCKTELAKSYSYAIIDKNIQQQLVRLTDTNDLLRKHISIIEEQLARGPRYVTQTVTKFVTVDDEEQSRRSMTWPTRVVETAAAAQTAAAEDTQPTPSLSRPAQEQTQPREQAQQTPRTSTESTRPNTTRNGSSRNGSSRPTQTRPPASQQQARSSEESKPRTRKHTVRPGETLQVLARNYGVSVSDLRKANPGLGNGTRAGQALNIPNK